MTPQFYAPLVLPTPQTYTKSLLLGKGMTLRDYGCTVKLWDGESHWKPTARNKASGAFGIPQALPAEKMAVEGSDWRFNPYTQARWGVRYLVHHWGGKPCVALSHQKRFGWY